MKKEWIGIDVSKEKLDVFLWKKKLHKVFQNNAEGFKELSSWIRLQSLARKSVCICFEHTGYYSEALAAYCAGKKIEFFLEPSLAILHSGGIQRGKNDKIDSRRIAEYLARNYDKLKPMQLQSEALAELKKLLSLRAFLEKQKKGLINRMKNSQHSKFIAEQEHKLLEQVKQQVKETEKQIRSVIKSDQQLNENDQLAQSIKGIGPVSSWHILATTDNFSRFTEARKYACYVGIAPFERSSGSSIRGKTTTDKRSNRTLNGILTMAANSAVLHNAEMREYYQRKSAQGKHHNSVTNAVKNKLILRVFAVVKRKSPYVDLKKYAA